jgi:co-chaperonin GroES (HSP10)
MSKIRIFKPINRYVSIVPHFEKDETDSGVLLPDDFKKEEARYIKATVVNVASDCKEDLRKLKYGRNPQSEIVIDKTMIEEIDVDNRKHYVILENYVLGIYRGP